MDQREYEVIVVDDGSTDNTDQVLEEVREWIANLHYIKKTEKRTISGNSAITRNIGSKYARGNILLETDPEVMPMPDWIYEHWRAHQVGEVVLSHAGFDGEISLITIESGKYYAMLGLCLQFWQYNIIDEHCRGQFFGVLSDWDFRKIEYVWKELNRIIKQVEAKCKLKLSYPHMKNFYVFQQTQAGMSLKKDLFLKIGGYDEIFCSPELDLWGGEDTDFNYRLDRIPIVKVENPSIRAIHLYHSKRIEGYRSVEYAHRLNKSNPDRKVANEGRNWGVLSERWKVVF